MIDSLPGPKDVLARAVEITAGVDLATVAATLARVTHEVFDVDAEVVVRRRGVKAAEARVGPGGDGEPVCLTHHVAASRIEVELRARGLTTAAKESAELFVTLAAHTAHKLALALDARELAREQQEIVAIVSHDLRTPLQSLGLGLDALDMLVAGTLVAAPCASTLARMQRAVGTMSRLLGDLLDVTRIRDGALSVRMLRHDARGLLNELCDQHAALAATRGFELQVGPSDVGDVVCDAGRWMQALSNLITNAIQHANRGPIELRASREGDRVRFEVEDHGPGIPEPIRTRLFDRLYRADDDDGRGLGLGLYIAKGIAVAHGGRIGVVSEVGRGSTFWIEVVDRSTVAPRRTERDD